MEYQIIRLSSVTYAIRAQKMLERNGIKSFIRKHAASQISGGCGYGVEVRGDIRAARGILQNAGISIK